MKTRSIILAAAILLASGNASVRAEEPGDPFAELLNLYKSHELPLPPPNARLVRYEARGALTVNGTKAPPIYSIAFELKPATKTDFPVLLRGTQELKEGDPRAVGITPDVANLKDIELDAETCLVLAVQCKSRGWDKLAEHLLEKSKSNDSATKRMANLAWQYWTGEITHPTRDRTPVAKHLKALIKADPELEKPHIRQMLDSLDLALVPSKSKPGSIEALIDGLVDDINVGYGVESEAYLRVADLGFEAVPALIEHLDDKRLTRAKAGGFMNFSAWNMQVRDVAGDLIEGLAGEELDRGETENVGGGWVRREQAYPVMKAAAKTWWAKASKVGEENYILDRVVPKAPPDGGLVFINKQLLRLIERKYPKRLPDLYRSVLAKSYEVDSSKVAESIGRAKLTNAEKIEILSAAAKHERWSHRGYAFYELKDLDKQQFDSLLLDAIETLPKDAAQTSGICHEAFAAVLAIDSEDPKVWAALEKAVARSSLGLRMEMLNDLANPLIKDRMSARLRLLAGSLADDRQCRGLGAGFPRIEVRNRVALMIAKLLDKPVEVKRDRTAEEWSKVRDDVRGWLKKEGIDERR